MMARDRLPPRRHGVTQDVTTADGKVVTVTVGFDHPTWRVREVFLTGAKVGGDMAAILDDASVVISVALQNGVTAREMAHSVSPGRASVIGAALELIAGFEEDGPDHRPRSPDLKLVPS